MAQKPFFARISDFRKQITESLFLEGEIRYHKCYLQDSAWVLSNGFLWHLYVVFTQCMIERSLEDQKRDDMSAETCWPFLKLENLTSRISIWAPRISLFTHISKLEASQIHSPQILKF